MTASGMLRPSIKKVNRRRGQCIDAAKVLHPQTPGFDLAQGLLWNQ
jgi:hypothetical protein